MVYHGTLVTKYLNIDPVKGVYIFNTQGRIYVMKSLKIVLLIGLGITALNSATEIKHTDKMFVGKSELELKRMAAAVMNENAMLKAGGGGAGPALPSEIRALVQCVNTNTCDPYIALAKEKIKAELAKNTVIPDATPNKVGLVGQLSAFIDTLNNGNLGVAIPGAGAVAAGGNPAANEVKTLNALKCAIDVAMVQKVNVEMDRIAFAGAPQIKEALMAVFAGR